MEQIDLAAWARQSEQSTERSFRQAVHTLMLAISQADDLQARMIFHGGLLLAIRFQGIRHTKDIDFVTSEHRKDFDVDKFVNSLNEALALAGESLPYGLGCRIQSNRIKPPGDNRNFQTLKMNMGYAYKESREHRRLMKDGCPTMIDIDYSFNEFNEKIDTLQLVDGGKINVYSLPDLAAEKYRAMLQQKNPQKTEKTRCLRYFSSLDKRLSGRPWCENPYLSFFTQESGLKGACCE